MSSSQNDSELSPSRPPFRKIAANEEQQKVHSSAKRPKVATSTVIEYPQVNLPPKDLVRQLHAYAEATNGDQAALTDAGLLSLQEVLLPAVAHQEDEALKQVQAKLARDDPDQVELIVTCRKAVYDCMSAAQMAVARSREERLKAESKRQEAALKKKKEQEAERAEEKARERAFKRAKRKDELIKKLPRNQELWREVVYLMTELSKLQKEEKMWKDAKEKLDKELQDVKASIMKQQEEHAAADKVVVEAPPCKDMDKVMQTVQGITISSVRIQNALTIVSDIATESDQVRQELYQRYTRDHQFHGYQGVKNIKGVLRSLSQSQTQDDEV